MQSITHWVACKVSEALGLHANFASDPMCSLFHDRPKIEFITYIYILLCINILIYKNYL